MPPSPLELGINTIRALPQIDGRTLMAISGIRLKHLFFGDLADTAYLHRRNTGGIRHLGSVRTQPKYRMYSIGDDWFPGVIEVETGGVALQGEICELTYAHYEHLLSSESPDKLLSTVVLETGEEVAAMLYPATSVERHQWPDISQFGSWAAYKASLQPPISA